MRLVGVLSLLFLCFLDFLNESHVCGTIYYNYILGHSGTFQMDEMKSNFNLGKQPDFLN